MLLQQMYNLLNDPGDSGREVRPVVSQRYYKLAGEVVQRLNRPLPVSSYFSLVFTAVRLTEFFETVRRRKPISIQYIIRIWLLLAMDDKDTENLSTATETR